MRLTEAERAQVNTVLARFWDDSRVQSMAGYTQHGLVSTLDHCTSVAQVSWWLARRLHVRVDSHALLAGAFLHDFYLYDWHGSGWQHSYKHAGRARKNACEVFGVDKHTQAIIRSHMWPLGIAHPPRSREALLVCLADKYVSLHETLLQRKRRRPICG